MQKHQLIFSRILRCFANALDEFLFPQSLPPPPSLPFNTSAYPDALDEFGVQMRELVPYSKVQNMACEKLTGEGIGRFLGTESVARDLERIIRAIWRKSDVEKGVNFWGFIESKLAGPLERLKSDDAELALLRLTRLLHSGYGSESFSLILQFEAS